MDKTAPGRLELVRAFLNTADLETGADQFRTAAGLERWLTKQKLIPGPPAPPECDGKELETAVALREALRALCLANNGLQPDLDARTALDSASANLHLHLTARFGADGKISLEPDETGIRKPLAELLAIVFGSLHEGTWSRLKACAAEDCQFAFYDHSKNRSGHWCTMAECGNRAKVRSYRARQAPPVAVAG
jgi:predicted RNA-binding Zn ribbon-like protein